MSKIPGTETENSSENFQIRYAKIPPPPLPYSRGYTCFNPGFEITSIGKITSFSPLFYGLFNGF
jgi:hypothetical protein